MRMAQANFADVLMDRIRQRKSQLVVGLDPRVDRLPAGLRPRQARSSAAAAAHAMAAFNRAVLDAVAEHAAAVKCQVAFYEQYGCEGMHAYSETVQYARDRGVIVIGDTKRNDIASTAAAYATAHLGTADGSPAPSLDFIVDAVTVNAYLGSDGVMPFVEAAAANGRGVFALVKTSNPSSVEVQDLDAGGEPLYRRVAALVEGWGRAYRGRSGYSLLGAVVGATFPGELALLRELMPTAPFLVPGVGAQGGRVQDVAAAFDEDGLGAVVNSSRDIIFAWERAPYDERYGEARWQEAVGAAAADLREQLWQATH
jgi:orotidine-5'-phosphate decarboxylase